jgi:hypothetical protein
MPLCAEFSNTLQYTVPSNVEYFQFLQGINGPTFSHAISCIDTQDAYWW